jgi:lipoate-protein ligase A
MYGVVLSYTEKPELRMLDQAHAFVLSRIAGKLRDLGLAVAPRGTSDLVVGDRKFSGNSLRSKRDHFLYHGTILYDFALDLIGQLLRTPPRQPGYRAGRPHGDFVGNLPLSAPEIRSAIAAAFVAETTTTNWPRDLTRQLVASRYSRDEWNFQR